MAAQTNNMKTPTLWQIHQALAAQAQPTKQNPYDTARAQSMAQAAQQGNDPFLLGMVASQLLKGGWNSMKKEYDAALAEKADGSTLPNNLYTLYRKVADPLVKNLFGSKKKDQSTLGGFNEQLAKYHNEEALQVPNEWKQLNPNPPTPNMSWKSEPLLDERSQRLQKFIDSYYATNRGY